MTDVEKNAKWIQQQRTKIIKAVNKITSIAVNQNLNDGYTEPKYYIDIDISMSGNSFSLRVTEAGKDGWLVYEDITGLGHYLRNSIYFNKSEIEEKVKILLGKLKSFEKTVVKYANLN